MSCTYVHINEPLLNISYYFQSKMFLSGTLNVGYNLGYLHLAVAAVAAVAAPQLL